MGTNGEIFVEGMRESCVMSGVFGGDGFVEERFVDVKVVGEGVQLLCRGLGKLAVIDDESGDVAQKSDVAQDVGIKSALCASAAVSEDGEIMAQAVMGFLALAEVFAESLAWGQLCFHMGMVAF